MNMGEALTRKWILADIKPNNIDKEFERFPAAFRQILYNRGFSTLEEAQSYLQAHSPLHDSYLLKDMEKVASFLADSITRNRKIAIYGDYDVDGVTATALLVEVIKTLGGDVQEYIPNRFDEGYGLNSEALQTLSEQDVQVIVTVDCGIRSPNEAKFANKLGLDLIISDHHHPRGDIPAAYAVICPKQAGDEYPNKDISGVGLAYKIAQALVVKFPGSSIPIESWLDLVALGTVADVVPLTGENRVLVRKGLEVIHSGSRPGVIALSNMAGVKYQEINSTDIGFKLGPRLNASGRLESAIASFRLLTARDLETAGPIAMQLDNINRERQKITLASQEIAERIAIKSEHGLIYFASNVDFNEGIVGLIASRLTEAHYRPSIAGKIGDESTRASCRSIPEFHITNALDECADLLVRHGGHAMAAGFTVLNENLEIFLEKLFSIAERDLADLDLNPRLMIDCEVSFKDLKKDLLEFLDLLNPTGAGNPEALFITRNAAVSNVRQIGAEGKHLRMTLKEGGVVINAVAFFKGEWAENMPEKIDVVYRFELNEYNGYQSLQANIKDIRESQV
jgi:single-stranded-DNA-specific exonuclease